MKTLTRIAWCALVLMAPAVAAAQMPDARQMSGIPMPSGDVPAGSVSVRLVRGDLSNNIVGHPVELHAGASVQTMKTDENGRSIFSGIAAGVEVHAVAIVDGEHLESQPFSLPPAGGVRLVLVAGAGTASPGASTGRAATRTIAPPPVAVAPGEVVFAGDSRIQIEFEDDTIEVFYLFDLVNPALSPVNPKSELTFQLPEGAEQAAMLEGSSTQAVIRGRTVSISGPFAPGSTPVRLAFSLAPAGPERAIAQTLPAPWTRVQVIMTRAGLAQVSSPQFATASEMGGDGQSFMLGTGGPLAANQELAMSFNGLPSRSHWGRYTSVALAFLVLALGVYGAMSARSTSGDLARRAQLAQRRSTLMADLVRVEEQHRAGTLDDGRYATRHGDLVDQLERVYGELDQQIGPTGHGQGSAA
jgi:hypothetical protein